jgi:hypothetical protein
MNVTHRAAIPNSQLEKNKVRQFSDEVSKISCTTKWSMLHELDSASDL